ncbi:MAG: molybdenum cofactor guanylyltransferase [Spirochaetaceae bacterium]|jgi:molybdopterin-guanine dinucleotide biosynthesis protein A|nr:molybdenum cofactor guanylyltransferase [Spirochaetaceae bacterium]
MTVKNAGALIVGGGEGKRIGYDKKNLVLNGKTLISSQITTLKVVFDEIIVSSNNDFYCENVVTVKDTLGKGPLAGIFRGLSVSKNSALFVTACDMPFISIDYIRFVLAAAEEHPCDVCAVKRDDGFIEPFNAVYKKSALPAVAESLRAGCYKVQNLFNKLRVKTIPAQAAVHFDKNGTAEEIFFNINYAHDLETAQARMDAAPRGGLPQHC